MNWFVLSLFSVIVISFSVIIQKIIISRDNASPVAFAVIRHAISGFFILFVAIIFGFEFPNFNDLWFVILINILVFTLGNLFYVKTLQLIEASVFAILFATNGIWVLILSIIFYGEKLTILQVFGILLIFISITLLAEFKQKTINIKSIYYGLLTGMFFGIGLFTNSYIIKTTDPNSWLAISFISVAILLFIFNLKILPLYRPLFNTRIAPKILAAATLYALGLMFITFAYKIGPAGLVGIISQSSIIITTILGIIILKEYNNVRLKIASATICALGIILIIIGYF